MTFKKGNSKFIKKYWQDVKDGKIIRKSQKKSTDIKCSQCGKMFYRSPANRNRDGNKNQYCSRVCMSNAFIGKMLGNKSPRWKQKHIRYCDNCKKKLLRPDWHINQGGKLSFCNHKCFGEWKSKNWSGKDNPAWIGGKAYYYGENWKRQSRETRKRDNHKCKNCGVSENLLRRALDVHHIKPFRFFGLANYKKANSLSNLVSLCPTCHKKAEYICSNGTIENWKSLLDRIK